jgi:ketosteroid isomerase-like protein
MLDHPNVERLRRGYEAYARGDLATLRGMFADTITLHFLGHTQLSGTYNGPREVLGYFERLPEIGAAFRFEVHDLLADDEHEVALLLAGRNGQASGSSRRSFTSSISTPTARSPNGGTSGRTRKPSTICWSKSPHPLRLSRGPLGSLPTRQCSTWTGLALRLSWEPSSPGPTPVRRRGPCPRCAPSTLHRGQATRDVRRSGDST